MNGRQASWVQAPGRRPGAPVAYLPVGLVAWDDQDHVDVDWAPDDERTAFWQGVVQRCRDTGTLTPAVVETWQERLANGVTVDLKPVKVQIPDGRTARDVFGEMAGQLVAEWAMLTTEVQDALDGRPSMLDLFRPRG